ncbi:MAG: hypothetical protein ACKVPY_04305, partial [Paracoccaceae bacterium]
MNSRPPTPNSPLLRRLLRRAATAALALAGLVAPGHASLITSDPSLPPVGGAYVTPAGVHATYTAGALQIILSQIQHSGFSNIIRTPVGADERENFDSIVSGLVSVTNGGFPVFTNQPLTLSGPVETLVQGKVGNVTGSFQTEMLALSLSGVSPLGPVMIRESPTLQTLGQTDIIPIGGGLYQIDSFFDVFTELSIDGGAT